MQQQKIIEELFDVEIFQREVTEELDNIFPETDGM